MAQVLVVEDEENIQKLITVHLQRERLDVTVCSNGEQAVKMFQQKNFDLIVLDWMLPDTTGIELCKTFSKKTPVLMVTSRSEPADIVAGLEMGADDYITKPFEIAVFIARVRAILRRHSEKKSPESTSDRTYEIGLLKVNEARAFVSCKGKEITLTQSEFKILLLLCANQGCVVSRDKILTHLQGENTFVVDRVVDTHIYTLRTKLSNCSNLIETIRGVGYRLIESNLHVSKE